MSSHSLPPPLSISTLFPIWPYAPHCSYFVLHTALQIDPHVSKVPVPDERFDQLVASYKPKSVVPAVLTVTDIAGLVKGAAEGAGLGNAFLSNIQAVDGIFHVCRAFASDEIVHVEGRVDPVADLEIIHNELRLKDLGIVSAQVEGKRKNVEREGANGKKEVKEEFAALVKAQEWLQSGKDIRQGEWSSAEIDHLNKLQLLTAKPMVYLVNLSEKDYIRKGNKFLEPLAAWVKARGQDDKMLPFSCEFEGKVFDMDAEARAAYLKEKATKSTMARIIKIGYHALNLCHFFTAGADEVRAWTIKQGSLAPQAAGTIHTDFLKNFIAAEVFSFEDWKAAGCSEAEVKAAGKYHTKGKVYEVADGDVCFFRIGQ
jgi:obg-like ATPase 1